MTAVPPGSAVAWEPEDLPVPAEQLPGYGYVVLEELVGRLALLRRWPWPDVDQFGRLVWLGDSEQDSAAAAIDLELLHAQLYLPNRLRRRPRCGDTFAVQDAGAGWPDTDREPGTEPELADLRELFAGAVYDVSADAREAAKLAYHAGLGAVPAAQKVDKRIRARQAETLQARAARPLRPLKVAAPPRGLR
ncbi:hypothetical protein [Jatrophihabitans sp.]|uniref:hypothetical protein n=1 Tax=Jatrophihabitans sp. TaxID=1932789 RepID=UPI002C305BAD|nr:hypothetical protein [Jatrophihabitans sp.]